MGWLSFPQSQAKEQDVSQPFNEFSLNKFFSILNSPGDSSHNSWATNSGPGIVQASPAPPAAALHPDTFEPIEDDETEAMGDYAPDFAFEQDDWYTTFSFFYIKNAPRQVLNAAHEDNFELSKSVKDVQHPSVPCHIAVSRPGSLAIFIF